MRTLRRGAFDNAVPKPTGSKIRSRNAAISAPRPPSDVTPSREELPAAGAQSVYEMNAPGRDPVHLGRRHHCERFLVAASSTIGRTDSRAFDAWRSAARHLAPWTKRRAGTVLPVRASIARANDAQRRSLRAPQHRSAPAAPTRCLLDRTDISPRGSASPCQLALGIGNTVLWNGVSTPRHTRGTTAERSPRASHQYPAGSLPRRGGAVGADRQGQPLTLDQCPAAAWLATRSC